MPEKIGDASLVPPMISQPGAPAPAKHQDRQAPPLPAALIEMSGVPRWLPTTLLTPIWKIGLEKTADTAPPREVTSGSADGQQFARYGYRVAPSDASSVVPASPDAPSTVTPWISASLKA